MTTPNQSPASSEVREEEPTRPVIFFREGFFYPLMVYEDEDLSVHAELNPGTLRIEDLDGNVLWRPQ